MARNSFFSSSHLTGRDELQGAQGDLEVSGVGLEVVESLSNALLELGGVLPRRAVGGDLVKGLGGHFGGDAQRTVLDEDRGMYRGGLTEFWLIRRRLANLRVGVFVPWCGWWHAWVPEAPGPYLIRNGPTPSGLTVGRALSPVLGQPHRGVYFAIAAFTNNMRLLTNRHLAILSTYADFHLVEIGCKNLPRVIHISCSVDCGTMMRPWCLRGLMVSI